MGLPTLTNPDFLDTATREELESYGYQVSGYLQVEHKSSGRHKDVNADSVTTTGNATVGADLAVTGDATVTDDLTVSGDLFAQGEFKLSKGLALAGEDSVLGPGAGAGDLSSLNAGVASVLRLTTGSSGAIAGMATADVNSPAGITGRTYLFFNDWGSDQNILHDSASSVSSSLRFYLPNGYDHTIAPNEMMLIWRDETDSRWRVFGPRTQKGTWQPTLLFGGASTGITYGTRTGTFTRVDNKVTIEMRIALTSNGSATGAATITGVPYTAALFPACVLDIAAGGSGVTGAPICVISSTTLNLMQTTATGRAALTDTEITDTADLRIGLTYRI